MSLVKYWVPFCRVTTVGVEQPAKADNAAMVSGKPSVLMFILTSRNVEKDLDAGWCY
ncbi:hypothetical protein D3C86_2130650 [compost metagenome]